MVRDFGISVYLGPDRGAFRVSRGPSSTVEGSTFMAYWLFKSEPKVYSFHDLLAEPDRTTGWDGVRNYQARNILRDQVKVGDGVLIYHSNADPPCIAGIAEVVRGGHPDPTAFDSKADHYDPRSDPANPSWYQVSIKAVREIEPPIALPELGTVAELAGMELLRKGSRLSVQPVTKSEWDTILRLAGRKTKQ
jgi:predicted RNA-binding protein with PUA-like domain